MTDWGRRPVYETGKDRRKVHICSLSVSRPRGVLVMEYRASHHSTYPLSSYRLCTSRASGRRLKGKASEMLALSRRILTSRTICIPLSVESVLLSIFFLFLAGTSFSIGFGEIRPERAKTAGRTRPLILSLSISSLEKKSDGAPRHQRHRPLSVLVAILVKS